MGELIEREQAMPGDTKKLIVVHVLPFWGHWKPTITLAVLIAKMRQDTNIQLLVTAAYHQRVREELYRVGLLRGVTELVKSRIEVINIGADATNPLSKPEGLHPALARGPRPALAIIDMFAGYYCADALCNLGAAVFFFYPCPTTSFVRQFGPQALGGKGNEFDDYKPAEDDASSEADRELKMWAKADGKIVQVPGMPPMYDYEWWPQEVSQEHDALHAMLFRTGIDFLRISTGTLVLSNSTFDGDAVAAAKSWHLKEGRTLHVVGPVSTPENTEDDASDDVDAFLDRLATQRGARSVIYISFGTVFWPSNEDRLWALLDVLCETQTPFVLAHNKPVPEDKKAMYEKYGEAMIRPWVRQQRVLAHSAVGWFMTHGGWNSMQEALLHSIPMIMWPLAVDQPTNVAVAARMHRVGFELVSVRTGNRGTRIPYHCETTRESTYFSVEGVQDEMRELMKRIKGKEGDEARRNVQELGRNLRESVGPNGEALRELSEFLDIHLGQHLSW